MVSPFETIKVLTQQLREMESDGVVKRKIYATVPPRVDYSLTELGESLKPILIAVASWGKVHESDFPAVGEGA
ncbi:winged helix-turn-helix transcriptional regulator [bacterium]|nr:winged helix-turn-helix transcriptional regulator [bacterium]